MSDSVKWTTLKNIVGRSKIYRTRKCHLLYLSSYERRKICEIESHLRQKKMLKGNVRSNNKNKSLLFVLFNAFSSFVYVNELKWTVRSSWFSAKYWFDSISLDLFRKYVFFLLSPFICRTKSDKCILWRLLLILLSKMCGLSL